MECFSLLDCFDIKKYKQKILQALSNQNERRRINFNELEKCIKETSYLYAKYFESNHEYGFCVAKLSAWDSKIIEKKCLKITYFFSTNFSSARYILNDFFQYIPSDIYHISYDNNLSPSFQDIIFEEKDFHIGLHYYDWVGASDELNQNFLNFHKRFNLVSAGNQHIDQLRVLTESFPGPGRFNADPYLKQFAGKIYSEWAANSVLDKRKKVIAYIKDDNVQGFITYDLPKEKTASLGILRLNESLDIGIISYSLLSFACNDLIMIGCENIYAGTSKNNKVINKIYYQNGFRLTDSGIQFHWINKSMI